VPNILEVLSPVRSPPKPLPKSPRKSPVKKATPLSPFKALPLAIQEKEKVKNKEKERVVIRTSRLGRICYALAGKG
jgi:hypothetical protein